MWCVQARWQLRVLASETECRSVKVFALERLPEFKQEMELEGARHAAAAGRCMPLLCTAGYAAVLDMPPLLCTACRCWAYHRCCAGHAGAESADRLASDHLLGR